MKKILLTFLIVISIIFTLKAQTSYYVMQVKGEIKNASTKKTLKARSKIKSTDRVIFKDKNAIAVLYSSSKGRFKLQAKKTSKKVGSEFSYFVKENLFPAKKKASSRSNIVMNNSIDFQNYFKAENFLVIGEKTNFAVNTDAYNLNENNFFFLRYDYKGEQINKKLDFKKDKVILSKSMFEIDGKSIGENASQKFKLMHYDAKKEEAKEVCDFSTQFVFADEKTLKEELEPMVNDYKKEGKNLEQISGEVNAHLSEFYGKPDSEDLKVWVSKTFSVER